MTHEQHDEPQPTPPVSSAVPKSVMSVDEKIMAENIHMQDFKAIKSDSRGRSPLGFIKNHRLPLMVASVAAVMLIIGIGVVAMNNHTNSQKSKSDASSSSSEPDDASVVESYNYADTSKDTDNQAGDKGSEDSSGSGTALGGNTSKPGIPTGLSLQAGSSQISAHWQTTSGANQYELQISRSAGMTSPRQVTSGSTSVVIPGLVSSTKYYLWIRAVNGAGSSGWSKAQSITTTPSKLSVPLPGKVASISLRVNSINSITLGWSAASNATRYSVVRAANSSMTSAVKEYAATSGRSYTINDLSSGTGYYFVIRPINSQGRYGPTSSVVYGKTRISGVSITQLNLLSDNHVSLKISSSRGAGSYQVRYATKSNFSGAKTISSKSTSLTTGGMSEGTKYYFQSRAVDGSYVTGWSKTVSVTTKAAKKATIRIADYNAWSVTKTNSADQVKRLKIGIAKVQARGAEIISMQEFSASQAQYLKGLSDWKVYRLGSGGNRSMGIVWRDSVFKLVSQGSIVLPRDGADQDAPFVTLERRRDKALITVMDVHLVAFTYGTANYEKYQKIQQGVVRDKALSLAKANQTVIVAGDFNWNFSNRKGYMSPLVYKGYRYTNFFAPATQTMSNFQSIDAGQASDHHLIFIDAQTKWFSN